LWLRACISSPAAPVQAGGWGRDQRIRILESIQLKRLSSLGRLLPIENQHYLTAGLKSCMYSPSHPDVSKLTPGDSPIAFAPRHAVPAPPPPGMSPCSPRQESPSPTSP